MLVYVWTSFQFFVCLCITILGVFVLAYIDHFIHVLFAFVVLGLVSLLSSQEIGWEERLRNDIFCVEWDV